MKSMASLIRALGTSALVVALCALAFANVATAATYTWNNADLGNSNWSTGGNWVGGNAPPTASSAHTFVFDATAPGTSVMDGNYTVGILNYTAANHTTDLSNNTLAIGAFSTLNSTGITIQDGALSLGASPINLLIGQAVSSGSRSGNLTLDDVTLAGSFNTLSVGKGHFKAAGTATLDLTTASLHGDNNGILEINTLELGVQGSSAGGASTGSLLFNSATGISKLVVNNSFHFGNGALGQLDGGVYKLPSNTSLTLGKSGTPINVTIGRHTMDNTPAVDARVIMNGGVFEGYIDTLTLGRGNNRSGAVGVLDLRNATLAASHNGTLDLNSLQMGVHGGNTGSASSGSLLFSSATGIAHLIVRSAFSFGSGSMGDLDGGVYKLPANTSLTIGQSATPIPVSIGYAPTFTTGLNASIVMSGGTFTGYMTSLLLGDADSADRRTANGTLDLAGASSVDILVTGNTRIGLVSGAYEGLGTLRLSTGTMTTGTLQVNNGTLDLAGTLFTVTGATAGALTLGGTGTAGTDLIDITVLGTSSGLDIEGTASTVLSVGASGRIDITFAQDPFNPRGLLLGSLANHSGIHYGLKWAGDHVTDLTTLGAKLAWNDTTYLTGDFYDAASIFYDAGTDATYVGFYITVIPEPSTLMLLVVGGWLLRRAGRRGRDGMVNG